MINPTIRLLVVDDHWMVATALAQALAQRPEVVISGVAGSLDEVRRYSEARAGPSDCPDVALIDFQLPDGTGVEAAVTLGVRCPLTRTVLMSAESTPQRLRAALTAGCVGYINKTSQLEDLDRAVHAAFRGEATFDAAALREVLSTADPSVESAVHMRSLSPREEQVLSMLAAGVSTEVMSTELYLSPHTIRDHVRNLTEKLGAHSRLEAVNIAARAGLVTLLPTPHRV